MMINSVAEFRSQVFVKSAKETVKNAGVGLSWYGWSATFST